jgi:hypothetical protein
MFRPLFLTHVRQRRGFQTVFGILCFLPLLFRTRLFPLALVQEERHRLLMYELLSKVQSARSPLPTKQMLAAMGLAQILFPTDQV